MGVFFLFLFPKADCIIFAASLFWVIYSILVESDRFRLEPVTFYFRSGAWYPLLAFSPKENSAMDHSTQTQSPFFSLSFGQLLTCFAEDPGAEWRPRESIWKQHPGVNKHGKFIILLKSNQSQSRFPNPSPPFSSLYSFHRSPPENILFLLFLS